MSRNASGTYTLPAGNPVETGATIEADWANDTMSDMGTSMSDSLSRSGKGGMLAPMQVLDGTAPLPSFTFTNAPNTGIYRAGAGDLRTSVLGVDVMRVRAGQVEVWDVTDSLWYPLVSSKTNGNLLETQDLVALQTVVPFTANIAGAALYVNGTSGDRGRLLLDFDYTYNPTLNEVTLTSPFADGTKLTASFHDETTVSIAASQVAYDNTTSGYTAENVQDAVDEAAVDIAVVASTAASALAAHIAGAADAHVATAINYDDTTSGLGGTVQVALDTLDGIVDNLNPPASWAVLTANATLTAGQRVFADTALGVFTVTLPITPTANDTVAIADYAGTWKDFPPIVGRNGSKIMGIEEDMNIDAANVSVMFTYVDSTQGWRMT